MLYLKPSFVFFQLHREKCKLLIFAKCFGDFNACVTRSVNACKDFGLLLVGFEYLIWVHFSLHIIDLVLGELAESRDSFWNLLNLMVWKLHFKTRNNHNNYYIIDRPVCCIYFSWIMRGWLLTISEQNKSPMHSVLSACAKTRHGYAEEGCCTLQVVGR